MVILPTECFPANVVFSLDIGNYHSFESLLLLGINFILYVYALINVLIVGLIAM